MWLDVSCDQIVFQQNTGTWNILNTADLFKGYVSRILDVSKWVTCFPQRFKSKFPHIQEFRSQLQDNMTIAMENAQLFGEKYDHLNGADTWPFLSLP